MDKLEGVYPYFNLDDNGALSLELDYNELKTEYNFTDKEVGRLDSVIVEQNAGVSYANEAETIIQPQVVVEDWKIYFTADEVPIYLGAAIEAGAPAVIAAIASLGSVVPGIGTVLGALAGIYSGSAILYQASQALLNNQGFYIGVNWNGVFPNPTVGTWNG